MPVASATPCNKPGCGKLTHGRFCDAHKGAGDDRRSAQARGYDSKWTALSKRYRQANPLCEQHLARDEFVPVALVDHIVPVHVAPDRRMDTSNLQSLCRDCHAEKTEQDVLRYGSATTHRFGAKMPKKRENLEKSGKTGVGG